MTREIADREAPSAAALFEPLSAIKFGEKGGHIGESAKALGSILLLIKLNGWRAKAALEEEV